MIELKSALESTGFFATVDIDSSINPALVTCKDESDNTMFTIAIATNASWTYTVYKDDTTTVTFSGTATTAQPVYFYTAGSDSAVIQIPNNLFIIISKTNTGGVGFVVPAGSGNTINKGEVKVACWGDDTTLSTNLLFTSSTVSNAMIGNHCQFVEIPMHGTYSANIYLPHAYYMPIAQLGMRGVVQEITGVHGTYLTNGFLAVLDDSGTE